MGTRFAGQKVTFVAFARESRKNKTSVIRTYQETITDALEACFCFKGFQMKDHSFWASLTDKNSYSEAIKTAIDLEEKAITFYLEIARRSKSFLATMPRTFENVADAHQKRKAKLQSMG